MRSFDFDQGNVVWDYLEDFLRDCFLIGRLAARAVLLRGHPGIKHNGRSQGDVRWTKTPAITRLCFRK